MVEQGDVAPNADSTWGSEGEPTAHPKPTARHPAVVAMARRLSEAYPTDADRIARVKENLLQSLGNDPQAVPGDGCGDEPIR